MYKKTLMMVWDERKRAENINTHGLDFADARDRFDWDSALVGDTYPSSHGHARLMAIGHLDDDLVTFVIQPLGTEAVSAISLRPASRKERKRYAEA